MKPQVKLKCPANSTTRPDERIVEFIFPGTEGDLYRQGGLIQFKTHDGIGHVNVYGCDTQVVVNGYRTGDGDSQDPEGRSHEAEDRIWGAEWPTEPGMYWFYGDAFSTKLVNVRIYFVQVRQVSNGVAFICEGNFMWPAEASPGVWAPVEVPPIPNEENIII